VVVRRGLFSRELCRNGTNLYPVVGVLAAIYSGRRGFTPPNRPPPLVFLVVLIFDLVVFSSLVAAGLYYRNKPGKRLTLL
jgi:hypothetical protein